MKNYRKELWFNTPHRRDFINITSDVSQCVTESGVREGFCLINRRHNWYLFLRGFFVSCREATTKQLSK
jgi:hypothetical protein